MWAAIGPRLALSTQESLRKLPQRKALPDIRLLGNNPLCFHRSIWLRLVREWRKRASIRQAAEVDSHISHIILRRRWTARWVRRPLLWQTVRPTRCFRRGEQRLQSPPILAKAAMVAKQSFETWHSINIFMKIFFNERIPQKMRRVLPHFCMRLFIPLLANLFT